jgi:hypothetical protein
MKSVHTRNSLKRNIEDLLDTVQEAQGHVDDLSAHGSDMSYLNASNSIGTLFKKIKCVAREMSERQQTFVKVEYCLQKPTCQSFAGSDGKVHSKGKANTVFLSTFCRLCGPRDLSVYDTISRGLFSKTWLDDMRTPYQAEDKQSGTTMTVLSFKMK